MSDFLACLGVPPSTAESWKAVPTDRTEIYARARFALSEAVRSAPGRSDVWFPAYICEEAVQPFRSDALTLRFYPVTDQLEPDWLALRGTFEPESVFVLVHHFGFPAGGATAGRFCAIRGLKLVEDAAHVLRPLEGSIGYLGHAAVYSPRKLLPLPAGGVLVSRGPGDATGMRTLPAPEAFQFEEWIARRIGAQIVRAMGVSPGRLRSTLQGPPSEAKPAARLGCATRTLKLMSVLEGQMAIVARRRRENYRAFLDGVEFGRDVSPVFDRLPDGVCPYLFALRVSVRRDELLTALRRRGIPAGTWPTLPVEVRRDPAHEHAHLLANQILTLPVHQDLTQAEVEYLAGSMNACLRDHRAGSRR